MRWMAGVESTQSPRERRRTIRTRVASARGAASSIFNGGLIDQHDRNIIPDRIEAMTLQAAQTTAIGLEFEVPATGGADEDLKQFRTDRHSVELTSLPLRSGVGWGDWEMDDVWNWQEGGEP